MKPLAGYRTRDSDRVEFREATESVGHDISLGVQIIGPHQLVVMGEVHFEPGDDGHGATGEWGRVGPPRKLSGTMGVDAIPAGTPLSVEDAKARDVTVCALGSGRVHLCLVSGSR